MVTSKTSAKWSAYRKAAELYAQQKYALAQGIKQAFQVVGVEL